MNYTLTKYLTADYFRENEFTKAFLELVDEVIFCCYMEANEILSQLSFENMDDEFFLAYQSFFLNGLSTYNINEIDRVTLSEWFSLIHARGELSDIFKLLKFGGSLKSTVTDNKFELYHNADVPEEVTKETKDGIIYAVTDTNLSLDEDFFINQQTPAGYRLGLIKTLPPIQVVSDDKITLIDESELLIHCIDSGLVDTIKEKQSDVTFYRRRQFDQYYTFKHLFQSAYTINDLSHFHDNGTFFNGFDIEIVYAEPTIINETKDIYTGVGLVSVQFLLDEGTIQEPVLDFKLSASFEYPDDFVTLSQVDGYNGSIELQETVRNNYSIIANEQPIPENGILEYQNTQRNNYDIEDHLNQIPGGGTFVSNDIFEGMNIIPEFIETNVNEMFVNEPLYIAPDVIFGGNFTLDDEVLLSSKGDLGGVINKNNSYKSLFDIIGWSDGDVIDKTTYNKQLFDLIGAYSGGFFPDEKEKCYIVVNNDGIITSDINLSDTFILFIEQMDTHILAYKQDGTTAICYKHNNLYNIPSAYLSLRTESELNNEGWYVKWRKYSISSSTSGILNIRPNYGTDNTPITVLDYGESILANPYLTGPSGYTEWLNIIISTDGGITTQSAWFDSSNNKLSYIEEEISSNICLL